MRRTGRYFCFVGPAGGGKTTVCDVLLRENPENTKRSVSATSRAPRESEIEGEHYYFIGREKFQELIDQKKFFEWEETHGNLYGTLSSELMSTQDKPIDLILDIDIRGALTFRDKYPKESVLIFLAPPSPEMLRKRLEGRKTDKKDLETRLKTSEIEYKLFLDKRNLFDYFVINNQLEETLNIARAILLTERQRVSLLEKKYIEDICHIN